MPPDPDDPAWLDPCLRIDYWQRDLIKHVFTPGYKQVMAKGCTKAGKGASTSIAIVLWWLTHPTCKIILTGPNYEHVVKRTMLPEVKNWLALCSDILHTEVQAEGLSWKTDSRKVLAVANPDSDEGFSGAHSENTLIVLDEASKIRSSIFSQAITQAAMLVALTNPRAGSTWIRRCYNVAYPDATQSVDIAGGKRRLITVGAPDCVNVKAGKTLIPAQVTRDVFDTIMAQEPEWPGWNECMGLGKFPKEDTDLQFFGRSWFETHEKYWEWLNVNDRRHLPCGFGLDVGASATGDPSCWAGANQNGICGTLHQRKIPNVLEAADWFLREVDQAFGMDLTRSMVPVVVDEIGVGKGCGDELRRRGVNAVRASQQENKSLYQNWRAEKCGELSRRLDPAGTWPDSPWALPPDEELRVELLAHEKGFDINNRIKVNPKDTRSGVRSTMESIKSKIGRSPNKADAVFYAYSAVASLQKSSIPVIRREIMAASDKDMDKLPAQQGIDPNTGKRLKNVRLDDLPKPEPVAFDLEEPWQIARRVAAEMNAADDGGWW